MTNQFLPTNHGFDRWFGLPYSNDMGTQVGDAMLEHAEALRAAGHASAGAAVSAAAVDGWRASRQKQPDQTMLTRRYVERSVEFVRDNVDRPFFLYFAHLPLYVEDTFHGDSRNSPYGAAVHAIDWATGVLLDELDALGLADDTIVIFTSDNGALARPGEGSNAAPWQQGAHHGGRNAGPGHHPLAGCCAGRVATN